MPVYGARNGEAWIEVPDESFKPSQLLLEHPQGAS
jgi:hypothetical protein